MKSISIIIPAYNEEAYIKKCLERVIAECEKYHGNTEIIVVDNNSTDNTGKIIQTFDVKYINSKVNSPGAVRNEGVKIAQFEIFAFLDGDCLVREGWLRKINEAYNNPNTGAYGGECVAPYKDGWAVTAWNPTELKQEYKKKNKLPGANFSIRANVFMAIKGFDEKLVSAEDDKLSLDVIALGLDCVLDNSCSVIHLGYPKTLKNIFLKQVWHGKTQISAHGFFGDKLVLVSYFLLTFILLLFLSIFLGNNSLLYSSVIGIFLCPLAVLINRLRYFHSINILKIPAAFLISIFFLLGRTVGLIEEIKYLTLGK